MLNKLTGKNIAEGCFSYTTQLNEGVTVSFTGTD